MKRYFTLFALTLALSFYGCDGKIHGNITQESEAENAADGSDFGADPEQMDNDSIGSSDIENTATGGVITDTTAIDTIDIENKLDTASNLK